MEIRSPNGISFPPTPENRRRALQWADCAKGSSSGCRSSGETCDALDSIPTRRDQRDSGSSHSSQRLVQHDSGSINSGCTTQRDSSDSLAIQHDQRDVSDRRWLTTQVQSEGSTRNNQRDPGTIERTQHGTDSNQKKSTTAWSARYRLSGYSPIGSQAARRQHDASSPADSNSKGIHRAQTMDQSQLPQWTVDTLAMKEHSISQRNSADRPQKQDAARNAVSVQPSVSVQQSISVQPSISVLHSVSDFRCNHQF